MTPILERLHLTFKNFSFPQLLPFDFHATLASELSKSQFYTFFLMVDPHFVRRVCAGPTKFAFCHVFVCPTCAISAEGCPCPKEIHIPPHVWAFETHDLRRRLLRAKKFRISPHLCPSDMHDLRRGLPKDKQDPHFATRLGVRHAAEGNVS